MAGKRTYAIEDFSGAILLIAALFALGLFNFKSDEPLVEAGLRAQSEAIVADSVHGMRVLVDGRDMTLTGLADSKLEKTQMLTALKKLEGRGRIRSEVEVLEPADPFAFSALHVRDKPMRFSGAVPTEAMRRDLRRSYGDGVGTLTLASGMPDEHWPEVVTTGVRALEQLEQGELRATARELRLTGKALTPDVEARIALLMEELPDGYVFSARLDVIDDGSPLRLTASRTEGAVLKVSGKLPGPMADTWPDAEIATSVLPPPFPDWEAGVMQAMKALDHLQNGHLAIIGPNMTLTGEAWSQAADDAVRAAMKEMPNAMQVSLRVTLADTGSPFALHLSQTDAGVRAQGKVPPSLGPRVLSALANTRVDATQLEVAKVSPGQDWWEAASLGTEALRWVQQGEMRFDGTSLTLTGVVQDPPEEARVEQHFAALPEAVALTLDLALIDDGTPLRMRLEFNGVAGDLSGKLPASLTTDQLADTFNRPLQEVEVVRTPRPDIPGWDKAALTGIKALALFRRGNLSITGEEMSLTGVLRNPDRETEMQAVLATLPETYKLTTNITFQDDGRPFAFELIYDGQRGTLNGKVPLDLGPASQAAIAGFPIAAGAVDFAELPADADWWTAARAGLKALSDLEDGALRLDAFQMTLRGSAADQTTADAATARLAPFADQFTIETDIIVR